MNDTLLDTLKRFQSGEQEAANEMVEKMMPSIRKIASHCVCPGFEYEDAVQEGVIALFDAVEHYCEDRGTSFSVYATICMRNAMYTASRSARCLKHRILNQSLSVDQVQQELICEKAGPEQMIEINERFHHTMQGIATRLSGRERQVLLLFLEGASYAQIADHLQISLKSVDNALQRVRTKLK